MELSDNYHNHHGRSAHCDISTFKSVLRRIEVFKAISNIRDRFAETAKLSRNDTNTNICIDMTLENHNVDRRNAISVAIQGSYALSRILDYCLNEIQ